MKKRNTLTLEELFKSIKYKKFIKKQIFYALHPWKHFKERVLEDRDEYGNIRKPK